jgi:CHAD domain-containing protein
VKARKVKGLDPAGALVDNAERIVAVRLDELCAFAPRVLDPAEVEALHDMRIAAKRLRYVLEVTGELFGPYSRTAGKRTKELQDLLGEIHDCDVLVPRVGEVLDRLRDADVATVLAGGEPEHGDDFRGLELLVVRTRARREELFGRFLTFWTELEREGFRARLEYAIAERPAPDHEPVPA